MIGYRAHVNIWIVNLFSNIYIRAKYLVEDIYFYSLFDNKGHEVYKLSFHKLSF